ncbi:MAG: phosphoribosylaminoimidazolesuccinocarboxamide synthase [Armatimonadota bacterium]|nr:phosphoribosylaminoimidazolesuccinocarboxamide synthase [Armatimonadota bacterium]MDR5697839.1 phosphoribosylaminoimidazolesuccinocarboxamide synthase [Armatimonadota bacterium]
MNSQPRTEAADRPMPLFARGKVRDIYDLGDRLLIAATDRLSAFDVVLPTPIPDRGRVLTQLSAFWFERTRPIVPNHMLTADPGEIARIVGDGAVALGAMDGRAMLVRRARRIDFECVVRGYLAGSGWKDYRRSGAVCGVALPPGLVEGARLPEPIFTPATKNDRGHDENVPFAAMVASLGAEVASRLRDLSLALYRFIATWAFARGLICADTKFEFGWVGDEIVLIDEAGTPDSSRYWDRAAYEADGSMASFDKQFVRDYLERIGWNKEPPAPALPAEVVTATRDRYLEAYRRITGRSLGEGGRP